MQVGVLTPVLLWLLTSQTPQPQLGKCLRALESYLVRRMNCGLTTKDYNHLFIGLLERLEKAEPEQSGDTVVGYLSEQVANAREWPTDYDLESAFVKQELFKRLTRGRLRIVLEGIEAGIKNEHGREPISASWFDYRTHHAARVASALAAARRRGG